MRTSRLMVFNNLFCINVFEVEELFSWPSNALHKLFKDSICANSSMQYRSGNNWSNIYLCGQKKKKKNEIRGWCIYHSFLNNYYYIHAIGALFAHMTIMITKHLNENLIVQKIKIIIIIHHHHHQWSLLYTGSVLVNDCM